uniref:CW domain-containing protein n=1 Tax=Caenorhabditis tropicalis TaxID=1561998 RepID=A0A1I7UU87_9PELO
MVKIYGKVDGFTLERSSVKAKDDCVEDCFESANCFLVFMYSHDHCGSFDFNLQQKLTVSETSKASGYFVAFKTFVPSNTECPLYEELNLVVPLGNGDPIAWEAVNNGWTFTKCFEDWKMFKRNEELTVCMQTFYSSIPVDSIATAQKNCADKGHKLTGVGSYEELKWIQAFEDPEDCLIVCKMRNGEMMNDDLCENTPTGYGYVCGYQFV